jgi:hypothetical protein
MGYGQDCGNAISVGVAAAVESGARAGFEQPIAITHAKE